MYELNQPRKNKYRGVLFAICLLYVGMALMYSFLTPAWEANDEADHVRYSQYIITNHDVPEIKISNGFESHQPPLYYASLALWQKVIGAPVFYFHLKPNIAMMHNPNSKQQFSHDYSPSQRQEAIWLHELRILSVLFGLGTVILTFLTAKELRRGMAFTVASTLFVVLLPKFLVVSSVVTNDSLVITLCVAVLFLAIKACNAEGLRANIFGLAAGVIMGSAILTKFNSLPLAFLLFSGLAIRAFTARRDRIISYLFTPILFGFGTILVSAGWFYHNVKIYGDPLAKVASNQYLADGIPRLIKEVPWFDIERFFVFLPSSLLRSSWYHGGGNQINIPLAMSIFAWILAIVCLYLAIRYILLNVIKNKSEHKFNNELLLILAVCAGLFAVMAVVKNAFQAEGRITYIGLSAFAILCTEGAFILNSKLTAPMNKFIWLAWPLFFTFLNIYIMITILLPFQAI